MNTVSLPPENEMWDAFVTRDSAYEGIFVTGVTTTGIFCRPTCSAKKPLREHVEFFGRPGDALEAGYRPCRRCRPMEEAGRHPIWIRELLEAVEVDPSRRWRDRDLEDMGLSPSRVRRWFQKHHGMSFHAYSRCRRLGNALGLIREGNDVTRAAFSVGYESLSGFNEAFRKWVGEPPTGTDAPVCTVTRITTPLGPMVAAELEDRLVLLEFTDRRMLPSQFQTLARRTGCVYVPGTGATLAGVAAWLESYFEGEPFGLTPRCHTPGTEFQETVWTELRRIPVGSTVSYAELAQRIGRPAAVRAVARANGDNRVAIVTPCHRVIGSDGTLTGYGGGLWRKRALLELEGAL